MSKPFQSIVEGRVKRCRGSTAFGMKGFKEVPMHIVKKTRKGWAMVPNPEYAKAPYDVVLMFGPESYLRAKK